MPINEQKIEHADNYIDTVENVTMSCSAGWYLNHSLFSPLVRATQAGGARQTEEGMHPPLNLVHLNLILKISQPVATILMILLRMN